MKFDTRQKILTEVSVKLLWEKNAGKVEVFELKPTFVSLEHVIDEIREEINRGKDALIEFSDKNNDEREELEEAIKHLEGLIKGNASHDEIVRNYEKLGEKIDNFIASEDEEDDTCEPDGDGNGGSEGDGNGGGNDNEGSGGDDNSGDDNGEDNDDGNLPNTGSPIGTEGLMLMGSALATVGGITLKKRKK